MGYSPPKVQMKKHQVAQRYKIKGEAIDSQHTTLIALLEILKNSWPFGIFAINIETCIYRSFENAPKKISDKTLLSSLKDCKRKVSEKHFVCDMVLSIFWLLNQKITILKW